MTRAIHTARSTIRWSIGWGSIFMGVFSIASLIAADDATLPPPPFAAELLGLPRDRLLLWHRAGRAELRDAMDDVYRVVLRLPVQQVFAIHVDSEGFLVPGTTHDDGLVVVRMSAQGQEVTRWRMPGSSYYRLRVKSGEVFATGVDGSVRLEPDGRLGPVLALPDAASPARARRSPPSLFDHEADTVMCDAADHSLQHAAQAMCARYGKAHWRFSQPYLDEPLSCGDWLILRTGKRFARLQVRSLATGRVEAERSYAQTPVVICGSPHELFVGEEDVEQLRLPSLAKTWTAAASAVPVRALTATESQLFYWSRATKIVRLHRPPVLDPSPR